MSVLVDTSVWIDYFRGTDKDSDELDTLIDENIVATNDVILAELFPYLKLKKQTAIIRLMKEIHRVPLQIDWKEIIELQVKCLKNGINGIGIPDLIIAQDAKMNNYTIYSRDKHFSVLSYVAKIKLFN